MKDADAIAEILRLTLRIEMDQRILAPHENQPPGSFGNRHQFGRDRPIRNRSLLDPFVLCLNLSLRQDGAQHHRTKYPPHNPPFSGAIMSQIHPAASKKENSTAVTGPDGLPEH